jgi:hypothetical protein
MNKGLLPDLFETKLRQKYHSAKLTEIKRKKTTIDKADIKRHSSRKTIAYAV